MFGHNINADFTASKKVAADIIAYVLKKNLPAGVCLNVNIPRLHTDEIRGIKICRQANATWVEELDERTDRKVEYKFEGGIAKYVADLNENKTAISEVIWATVARAPRGWIVTGWYPAGATP